MQTELFGVTLHTTPNKVYPAQHLRFSEGRRYELPCMYSFTPAQSRSLCRSKPTVEFGRLLPVTPNCQPSARDRSPSWLVEWSQYRYRNTPLVPYRNEAHSEHSTHQSSYTRLLFRTPRTASPVMRENISIYVAMGKQSLANTARTISWEVSPLGINTSREPYL